MFYVCDIYSDADDNNIHSNRMNIIHTTGSTQTENRFTGSFHSNRMNILKYRYHNIRYKNAFIFDYLL